tara:strand:- start:126 stop:1121 length:996 start_codon:yes stop_codon:yes gene_type:complete
VTGLGAATGYFTLDRFNIAMSATAGRFTMTQTADGPNGISANCLKLDCTTADTSIAATEHLIIQHKMEGQNLQRIGKGVAGAKEITVSFYVKANAAFTFGCELYDADNVRQIAKLFDTTTGWNRIELTFPADVDDGSSPLDDDNANSFELNLWLHSGSSFTSGGLNTAAWANNDNTKRAAGIDSFFSSTDNNFFITGVQMEVGPIATEFEQEDISTTLAKCQRYYRSYGGNSNNERLCTAYAHTTTQARAIIENVVEMRAAPSIAVSDVSHWTTENVGTNTACSAIAGDQQSSKNTSINFTIASANLTAGDGLQIMADSETSARLEIIAEL